MLPALAESITGLTETFLALPTFLSSKLPTVPKTTASPASRPAVTL